MKNYIGNKYNFAMQRKVNSQFNKSMLSIKVGYCNFYTHDITYIF